MGHFGPIFQVEGDVPHQPFRSPLASAAAAAAADDDDGTGDDDDGDCGTGE